MFAKGQTGFWGAIVAVITLAVIAVLVRPGSQAPGLAKNLTGGAAGVLTAAEGGNWQG